MLRGEFKKRTGRDVSGTLFDVIHMDYMESKLDKDEYCKTFTDIKLIQMMELLEKLHLKITHDVEITNNAMLPKEDLGVKQVLSITVGNSDDLHRPLNELGSVTLYCDTNDDRISADFTAYNIEKGIPATVAHLYGPSPLSDEVDHVEFSLFIDILKSIKDEPLKSIAQILLNDLTVRFADIIKKGE